MDTDPSAVRSRRSLLVAAAGSAAALAATAASAALPLAASAAPASVMTEQDNPSTADTSITDSGAGSTAFIGNATGTGSGFGVEGTSLGAGGVVGWSVQPPTSYWPAFDPAFTKYTGVFGSAPHSSEQGLAGSGVWGDSPDSGVYGSGGFGVEGFGAVGAVGEANKNAGSIGVWAWTPSTAQVALRVTGKASFDRAGRASIAAGASTKTISMAGVTSASRVFAVLASNRSGRWVRAVVPTTNAFTIYLNTSVTTKTVVTYIVFD
jgi:hypothetical protein